MIIVTNNKRVNLHYSVNFIDENDLYIGFDDWQSCCEYADWFVSDLSNTHANRSEAQYKNFDLDGWNFVDPRILPDTFHSFEDPDCDEGGHVAFMIIHPELGSKWLHFFNVQNGYYGHEVLMGEHHNGQASAKIKQEHV